VTGVPGWTLVLGRKASVTRRCRQPAADKSIFTDTMVDVTWVGVKEAADGHAVVQ